jgi:hypothetical protein
MWFARDTPGFFMNLLQKISMLSLSNIEYVLFSDQLISKTKLIRKNSNGK